MRALVEATGFFRPDEVEVAAELVREALARGVASGYRFIFADDAAGRPVGYACYGEIACTLGSYDLFWIVVDPAAQGRGLGRRLLREAEADIAGLGGRRVYIETSSQEKYRPTQGFYERCGYALEARLVDFYDRGDDKLIYVRALS